MDVEYWNAVADSYDDEIFDSINQDRNRVVERRVEQFQSPKHVACDFGCGVGKYVPLLARHFKMVYAIDHSPKLLEIAKAECAEHQNVRFVRGDLVHLRTQLPKIWFAVCTNVLIAPDRDTRLSILNNVHGRQPRGGHLMLLVPSTESVLYTNIRLIEWNRRCGHTEDQVLEECLPATARNAANILKGTIPIEGVPTKHYLREEILLMLRAQGYEPLTIDKLEFDWTLEFDDPPDWLRSPYPWDWLIVARKK